MEQFEIRQGDQYSLPFQVLLNGQLVTDALINSVVPEYSGDIEITIGGFLRKTYRNNEIKFNKKTFTFDFPLTQEDTFELGGAKKLKSQVRVKLRRFNENDLNTIYSYDGPDIIVINSLSIEQI